MRDRLGALLGAATVSASVVCGAVDAHAQTGVLSTPPASAELRELRVAVAANSARSTFWFSARLLGAADAVFVIVPVQPGYAVDVVSDAWFESLEAATFPRVFPPDQALPDRCPNGQVPGAGALDAVGKDAHAQSAQPLEAFAPSSFSELVLWAQGEGLDLSFEETSALADLDVAGFRFLTVRYEVAPGEQLLRALRVTGRSALTRVPLLLTRTGAARVPTTVWIVSEGRAVPAGLPWTTLEPSELQWLLSGAQPPTNYRDIWSDAMLGAKSALWVIESAAYSTFYRSASYPQGVGATPSVAEGYLERAAGYGDAVASYGLCVARVASLENAQSVVASPCAPGSLAAFPGPQPCVEAAAPGETDPEQLRCGQRADDLAFALGGKVPSRVWVTRWSGEIPAWTARAQEPFATAQGAAVSQILRCGGWDDEVCRETQPDGGSPPGAGGGTTPHPSTTGGGAAPGAPEPPEPGGYYEDEYYQDDDAAYVEASCWGDSSSSSSAYEETEQESCSGDSSSAAEEEDSCSGDSSDAAGNEAEFCAGNSSSSEGDDSCAGDSSSAESEESCSGDSSSSSSSADSCDSGGSSSSSGGDSCSGSSGSSSPSDCAVGGAKRRGRGGRLPSSAFAMLLVSCYLMARRRRRDDERLRSRG